MRPAPIRVMNVSLATNGNESYQTDPLCRAVRSATAAGITVVAAAGNFGLAIKNSETYGSIGSPAIDPTVITVGSAHGHDTAARTDETINKFSSRGPTRGKYLDANSVARRDNFLKTWETVSRVPFFAALGPAAIADVTNVLRTMDLPPRTMIIRKGQQGDCMYFIAAGEVEVDLPGGKKVALGEGAFFGEMALLGNATRNANITTTGVTRLLVLDLVDFRLLMARHPDLGQTIDAEAKRRAQENK